MMGLSLYGDSAQLHIPAHNPTIVTTPCTVLYCTVLYCATHNPTIVTTRCSSDPLLDWPPSLQLTKPDMFLPIQIYLLTPTISVLAKNVSRYNKSVIHCIVSLIQFNSRF